MLDKINNNQIQDALNDLAVRRPTGLRSNSDSDADASLQVSYESLVEQANQEPADDAKAVERARQMLLSGELDRPENIRKAAEKIAKFGV